MDMKLFENAGQREIEGLVRVEDEIRRHERRERLHMVLIAGLGMMVGRFVLCRPLRLTVRSGVIAVCHRKCQITAR